MSGAEVQAPPPPGVGVAAESATESGEFSGSQSHNRTIATGVIWQGGLRWLAQVLSWTATIVVARRLSPSDYGIAGTATFITSFMLLVIDGGLARAIVVIRQNDPKIVSQVHTATVMLSWVLALCMCAAAYPISLIYREPRVAPVILLLALVILLNGATSIRVAVLQQRLEYRRVAQVEFTRSLTQAALVLICALLGFGYWSLSIGLVSGYLMGYAISRQLVTLPFSRPQRADLTQVVGYSGQLLTSALAWYLYSSGDFAILGRVAGLTALGYYQFAWNIAQLPGEKLANVLQSVVLPFFGSIGTDRRALRHYFLVLSELLVAVVLPILAGFALLSPIAVPLIFGDRWSAAIPPMQILVACAAMSSVSLLSQHVLGSTGKAAVSARLHLYALMALPPSFYLGARLGGPIGVAVAWLVFQPLLVGYPLFHLKDVIDVTVRQYLANLIAPVTSVLVMIATVVGVRAVTAGVAPVLQIALLSIVGALVYGGTYWWFFRSRVERILEVWRNR